MIKLMELNELITSRGLKKTFLAAQMGISDASLRNKLSGKTGFMWGEIQVLARELHLTPSQCNDIFFCAEVAEKATKEVS